MLGNNEGVYLTIVGVSFGVISLSDSFSCIETESCLNAPRKKSYAAKYTTQNLLRITFSFNDLMLKTNRLKKDFFFIKIG